MPPLATTAITALQELSEKDGRESLFDHLVEKLRDALGPSSGLDSDDVDPQEIQNIMRSYISDPAEWRKYAMADPSRNYTRNLVDEGNGKSNLLVLVWTPGKESAVHDHANAHCIMKILKGSLKETLYTMPRTNTSEGVSEPLERNRETVYKENEVTYISDKIGLHKISNCSSDEYAISLHLYTPPHAARHGFNMFDEKTGKASHIKQAEYYSYDGQKI